MSYTVLFEIGDLRFRRDNINRRELTFFDETLIVLELLIWRRARLRAAPASF
jgi:hypothetical protein